MPAPSERPSAERDVAGRPDPGDALVDVVDDAGSVLATATRRQVRAANLLHRSVFIAVLDREDRLVVHQRADWKDVWPARWDVAFGGVVDAGEDWALAAVRELAEEAGVDAPLERLGPGRYEDDAVRELAEVFLARSPGPFTFPDGEVVASDRIALGDLDPWLAAHEVVPDSVAIVMPLLRERLGF